MFYLKYLKATNLIGFRSGLGKKTVEIDLSDMLFKSMYIILGENGTGKTTFASLIPPAHTPFGTDKSFVMEGKEGLLIREYITADGEIIATKCVYLPKKDGGHTTSAYFGMYKNKEYIELNPTGKIGSYYDLVYTHFKVNLSILNLTYYDDNIKSLIKMSRSERIAAVNKYIPANDRYNSAYAILNEKYKSARNIMKNIVQKLNNSRNEQKLTQLLETAEEYINNKSDKYEKIIKRISYIEGQMEATLSGHDMKDVLNNASDLSETINSLRKKIKNLDNYYPDIDAETMYLEKEKKLFEITTKISNSNLSNYKEELYALEESLERYENITDYTEFDIDELEKLLIKVDRDISELKYSENPKLFSEMSSSELDLLDNIMVDISEIISTMHTEHGIIFTKLFNSEITSESIVKQLSEVMSSIAKNEKELGEVTNKLSYYGGFVALSEKLELRPITCKIDTCPFIVDALEWLNMKPEIDKLEVRKSDLLDKLEDLYKKSEELADMKELITMVESINSSLSKYENLFKKYFDIDKKYIIKSLQKGYLPDEFNYSDLREIKHILSEKDLYEDLINNVKPALVNKIELFKSKSDSLKVITNEIHNIKAKIEKSKAKIAKEQEIVAVYKRQAKVYEDEMEQLSKIREHNSLYTKYTSELAVTISEFEKYDEVARTISKYNNELTELKTDKMYINDELSRLFKERDTIKFELINVKNLKVELSEIEMDFTIMDILRLISQPGKGVTKETIDIFMQDIQEKANVLLSKTLQGKMSMLKFIIDDDVFYMPYSHNGVIGTDLADASSAQRNIATNCLSMALLSTIMTDYSIVIYDEPDKALSPDNRADFIKIIAEYSRYIGISSNYIITHSPEYYEGYDVGYILFPGYKLNNLKDADYIEVG